jgi:glycosyltransferase involved in cell wall biosynthesis
MQRPLRVSLVIPAYNEESHIAACLDMVAAQTVRPFEVIVVDNNSIDDTATIAELYDFVRIVREPKQGVVFARDAGFDAALGDIIGRIDVDTLLPEDWIATVQQLFATNDYNAVSGAVEYYDMPLRHFVGRIDLWFRTTIARKLGGEVYLFGANMAMRRTAWLATRGKICHARHLHEDLDLAVHLAEDRPFAVGFTPELQAGVSARAMSYSARSFSQYVFGSPRTYAAHGRRSQRCMYRLVAFLLVVYMPLRILYRVCDPNTGRISLHALLAPATEHVSPLTEPPLF